MVWYLRQQYQKDSINPKLRSPINHRGGKVWLYIVSKWTLFSHGGLIRILHTYNKVTKEITHMINYIIIIIIIII